MVRPGWRSAGSADRRRPRQRCSQPPPTTATGSAGACRDESPRKSRVDARVVTDHGCQLFSRTRPIRSKPRKGPTMTDARNPAKRSPKSTKAPASDGPPAHLEAATAAWFATVVADYELEPHHRRLLTLAAEAWDRATQAREQLARDGITFHDQNGNPRVHPCVAVERDARLAFARLIRELDLDAETLPAPRPPRRAGTR